MKSSRRGFTLVEILIVVIILGILAAIVIPQFTNASNDARSNSVASTLQTMRSQIELFKIQHGDQAPAAADLSTMLLGQSGPSDLTAANGGSLGPYLQSFPINPVNGWSTVAAAAASKVGWVYTVDATNGGLYTLQATDTTGTGTLTY